MSDLQNKQNSETQKQLVFPCLNIGSEDCRKAFGDFDIPKPAPQPSSNCSNKPKIFNQNSSNKNHLTLRQFQRAQAIFMQDVEILKYLENKYGFKIYEDKKVLDRELARLRKLWRIRRQVANKKTRGRNI